MPFGLTDKNYGKWMDKHHPGWGDTDGIISTSEYGEVIKYSLNKND